MSKFGEFVKDFASGTINMLQASGREFLSKMSILNRPIGIITKNYTYIRDNLYRNIGNSYHNYDGYGTPIGYLANPEMNAWSRPPWFLIDDKKNDTANYLEYINNTYFNGDGIVNNFISADEKTAIFDKNSLLLENAKVGVVRDYTISEFVRGANGDDIKTSPNSYYDTKLGALNNFYLNATLLNSRNVYNENINLDNSITSGVYSRFGFDGDLGFENSTFHHTDGRVMTNAELLGDIIPWSTTDHTYNSEVVGGGGYGNLSTVKNIFNLNDINELSIKYTDDTKVTTKDNLYYPFGNFYSITYSLGLTSSTGRKTKEFIAKSMLGYDLLGKDKVDIDLNNIKDNNPKKYYVGNGTRGTNYIDKIGGTDVSFIKYNGETNSSVVRMQFPDMGNDNLWSSRALYTYTEMEGNSLPSTMKGIETFNLGIEYGKHIAYDNEIIKNKKDIIYYTNKRFQDGSYNTLISRFHGDEYESKTESRANRDITQSAISKFGVSHGRNLLKKTAFDGDNDVNGYDNPYCRTWTYHHQYSTLKDVIRPFDEENLGINLENTGVYAFRTTEGLKKLKDYGVKTSNGLVRFSPTKDDKSSIKRCMFSIENLAWKGEKDFFKGHEDQKGPLGGRIMWFPPYNLTFSESAQVNWNPSNFIGRGESIYTYTNTERSGSLSFKILIDHPSIINQWRGEIKGGDGIGDVDDVKSNEQQLLRFFAGCELLNVQKPETQNEPKVKTIEVKVKDVETPPTTTDELVFYVFYPNNYSGVDDDANGVVKPMEYLINGIGANKYFHNTKIGTEIRDYGTTLIGETFPGYELSKSTDGISSGSSGYTSDITSSTTLVDDFAYQYVKSNKNGKPNYWGYRCDKAYENQVLHSYDGYRRKNYYDLKSYRLNSAAGYTMIPQVHTNDKETLEKGRLFSFADVFCAIQQEGKNVLTENEDYTENEVNIIRNILGINKEGYKILSINVKGFASSHGYHSSNDTLGINRARSVLNWLNKCYPEKFKKEMFQYEVNEIGSKLSNYDSNSFLAKVWRCSRVSIKIQKEEIINKSEIIDNEEGKHNITYKDNKTFGKIVESRGVVNALNIKEMDKLKNIKINGEYLTNVQKEATVNQMEYNNAIADSKAMIAKKEGNTINISNNGKLGYRNEYEFFETLKSEEPFLHSKIVEKLKYFDPAFHSITPEGFQSRLSFLHQCTRQGNTNSASDINNINRNANNLAFGRPPICILRIGDFFNTKIIIDNLQINYDETTWDLNDEGIGVMPMMANITISFKFLGGSDLSGPINRLQNALSFNYYANTSVYDSRAEEVVYDEEGKIKNFKFNPK